MFKKIEYFFFFMFGVWVYSGFIVEMLDLDL